MPCLSKTVNEHGLANSRFYAFKSVFGLFFIILVFYTPFTGTQGASTREHGPNIVVIIADDAGYNDVGYNGSEILTPNIDRLTREGARLDQHYVYPVCSPTRAALLTGRPPTRFGIFGPLPPTIDEVFANDTQMLSHVLKDAGYQTALIGKWHLGTKHDQGPNNYGFDYSYGYLGSWLDSYSHLQADHDQGGIGIEQWHRNGELFREHGHLTDLLTADAVDYIDNWRDPSRPFYLHLAYSAAHTPVQEPAKYTGMYEGIIDNVSRRFYAAAMTHMAEGINAVMNALERAGIEDETLVVFMSDNGAATGDRDYRETWLKPPESYNMIYGPTDQLGDNSPLRGWKGSLYEGGIRVPAFAYWSVTIDPIVVDEPINVCDWFPTFAQLANIEIPDQVQVEGMSVLPLQW